MLVLAGCGGEADEPARIGIYHLEEQVRGPRAEGPVTCGPPTPYCPRAPLPGGTLRYLVEGDPALDGRDVDRESVRTDSDPQTGGPIVLLEFTAPGARRFEQFTQRLAREGLSRRRDQHLVLVVDDRIVAAPTLPHLQYPAGLRSDTGLQISLDTQEQAKELAERMRRG